jgi:amidase
VWRLDARAQAALVRAGDASAVELVDAAIARIERLDPVLNAVVVPLYERALDHVRRGLPAAAPDAPFEGVPFLPKDAGQELAGTPHWVGTPVLRRTGHRSPLTTPLAARFEELGFVTLGKTNVPELSSGSTTEPRELGPTRNPWDTDRTAGGSSGGSAAAVAAGLVSVAHGADASGSLRFPAAACGLVTLKPTRGRVPGGMAAAGMVDPLGMWCDLVLTRTAGDLAAVFGLVAAGAPAVGPFATDPGGLRVGLLASDPIVGLPVDPACADAVHRTGALLEGFGHRVDVDHPPALDGLFGRVATDFAVFGAHGRHTQVQWLEERVGRALEPGDISPTLAEQAARGAAVAAAEVAGAVDRLRTAMAAVADWWHDHDILVTPTMNQPPWPIGSGNEGQEGRFSGGFPLAFSFTGQPAMSLPVHATDAGLPVGVQVVGRAGTDEHLLGLAAKLEEATAWPERWPRTATAGGALR